MDPKKQKRKFTHLNIPAGLWLYKGLNIVEKALIAEVDSLSAPLCYASNRYFRAFFGLKLRQTSGLINGLVKKGWLISEIDVAAGNKRVLRLTPKAEAIKLQKTAIVLSKKTAIGYGKKSPEGIAMEGGEGIAENCHSPYKEENKAKTKDKIKEEKKESLCENDLVLDLKNKTVQFSLDLHQIVPVRNQSERTTFTRLVDHLMEYCQQKGNTEIFDKALGWAKEATVISNKPRAIFIRKMKDETGFVGKDKAGMLLDSTFATVKNKLLLALRSDQEGVKSD